MNFYFLSKKVKMELKIDNNLSMDWIKFVINFDQITFSFWFWSLSHSEFSFVLRWASVTWQLKRVYRSLSLSTAPWLSLRCLLHLSLCLSLLFALGPHCRPIGLEGSMAKCIQPWRRFHMRSFLVAGGILRWQSLRYLSGLILCGLSLLSRFLDWGHLWFAL